MATNVTNLATVHSPNLSGEPLLAALATMPTRLNDRQLERVEVVAKAPLPALRPAAQAEMEDRLLMLIATLPKQSTGDSEGVLKVEGYLRSLPVMPAEQADFMMAEALRTCRWLPSPAELISIADRWKRSDADVLAQAKARSMTRREHEARLDEARRSLRAGTLNQDTVDALPERSRSILETQGLLHRCPDCGGHVARPAQTGMAADTDLDGALSRIAAKFGALA